jgi:hypothetical protein
MSESELINPTVDLASIDSRRRASTGRRGTKPSAATKRKELERMQTLHENRNKALRETVEILQQEIKTYKAVVPKLFSVEEHFPI